MNSVQEYYTIYDEAGRLFRDNMHRIEFITTLHFLKSICRQAAVFWTAAPERGLTLSRLPKPATA